MSIHNEAKNGEIAKVVLMPGDPLRAKYIAENFLEDYKLVNQVRNIFAYTGKYKGQEITVMASGMGMPSMGIYCYELYKFYDVETIIRIGSCGSYVEEINLLDTILVEESYTTGIGTVPAEVTLTVPLVNKADITVSDTVTVDNIKETLSGLFGTDTRWMIDNKVGSTPELRMK